MNRLIIETVILAVFGAFAASGVRVALFFLGLVDDDE